MDILDFVIVGGGPAGLTALIYLLMAKKVGICIDKGAPGGKLNEIAKIKNYPFEDDISGPQLAMKIYSHANSLGGNIKGEEVVGISKEADNFKIVTDQSTYYSKFVIIAIGTKAGHYGFKGEEQFVGKGVSYCATCDGFFFRGKDVAVVGDKRPAFDSAIYLSGLCNKVYLITNEKFDESNQSFDEVKLHSNIEVISETTLSEIKGENKVNSIDTTQGEFKVDGVFIFGSSLPSNGFYASLGLEENKGYLKVNESNQTSVDKIYACGDCISKQVRQIINASSEGMIAALDIVKRLNTNK